MGGATIDETWLRCFQPPGSGGPLLVCFPHAGGSASHFRALSESLVSRARVLAVQYPGRQDRVGEPCLNTIEEYADAVCAVLEPFSDRPLALFGHSFGAAVAFEVAHRLTAGPGPDPAALFVSSQGAPHLPLDDGDFVHLLDDEGLLAELRRMNGTGAGVLDSADVRRLVLPPTRADYAAFARYRFRPGRRLSCPLTALMGEDDPRLETAAARAWREHTTGAFALRTFPGGHFYLDQHAHALAGVITRKLPIPAG
jgi:pyochelin biosynthetic protein PchC